MYPDSFTKVALLEHIDALLYRFQNRALKDTVFRVGRDLYRKLHREDRLLGAIRNCEAQGLPWYHIAEVFFAAFSFFAGEQPLRTDLEFQRFL